MMPAHRPEIFPGEERQRSGYVPLDGAGVLIGDGAAGYRVCSSNGGSFNLLHATTKRSGVELDEHRRAQCSVQPHILGRVLVGDPDVGER